jgi:hypothetical protein
LLTKAFQRSILEADQDEITEEDGDMNDDELNELIARHKSEVAIFHEMDIQRDKGALESWRARGKRGNPPPPLMQFEELPECYQTDEPFDIKDVEDLVEGRGQRRRNIVSYNDGLSDDAWAMVCFSFEISFFFLTYTHRLLRKERTSTKFLNVPEMEPRIKRSEAYRENFSKKMIHRVEEHPHQKWTDGVASPRKERQKPMIMRILGPLVPRGNVV